MSRHSVKIPVEKLPSEINKIFEDYEKDLSLTMDDVVRRVANKGAQALRQSSLNVIGGRYSRGWGYSIEKRRMGNVAYIWQKEVPGLPHLLEYGHATTNGGRVPGRPHIAPVEDIIERDFVDTTKRSIENL